MIFIVNFYVLQFTCRTNE